MQLKDIKTNAERIKHALDAGKERDALLFVIADLEKRLKLLESRPAATATANVSTFIPAKPKVSK